MSFAPGSSGEFDFSKISFLVVDDKPFFREMVHGALRGRTRALRDATTVDKGVEVLRHYGPDINCIISDWDMTPLGGLDLLRMVRARLIPTVSPRVSYVILTARADTAAVKCAIDLDVNGFAVAPLSIEKLIKTIGTALRRTWMLHQPMHYAAVTPLVPTPLSNDTSAPKTTAPVQEVRKPAPPAGPPLNNIRICGIDAVQPGAILAKDLRDQDGRLLLPTGTELRATLIDQVRGAVQFLWIGDNPKGT
ncbi:MAG: two-component system response regulator [Rhodospirillaceae bacterium]